ncbi:MAG TPA: hypothetical protein VHV57_00590 [Acidimicrobiales bacterium]|jgi:4-amino-4-deoxy-L-arabinose transferase-like glycosyltransferase|nr:hypothetical protein [Acidimicrobiales bacterium]
MRTPTRSRRSTRFLLAFGIALALGFLLDGKFILVVVALVWVASAAFSLWRLNRS